MTQTCTAFAGDRRLAAGPPATVVVALRRHRAAHPADRLLVFDDTTGHGVDFDLGDSDEAAIERLATHPVYGTPAPAAPPPGARGRGRPKLGVVAREVTLLPQHWDWLATQPGGASVTLRRLVDAARRVGPDPAKRAREAAYRFMAAIAGNAAGYEEATRALFAGDRNRFEALVAAWPADIRQHALTLAKDGLS
ncbi:MAG: DUF2239 family protein [Proteobacteria bacterium]|nr:DUF2239 family protein [Pseudomonadota bacterium]